MNVILAPTPGKGFGHQFWAAMVGLDAAASFYNATGTEGRVLLDAGFWAEKSFPGRVSKSQMGPSATHSWARRLVPMAMADATSCGKILSFKVSDLLDGSAARRLRLPRNTSARTAVQCIRIEPGSPYACGHQWCRLAGSYDRSTRELRLRSAARVKAATSSPRSSNETNHLASNLQARALRVVWHLRTGDAVVSITRDSVARLRVFLDSGFQRRRVEHHISTYDERQLHTTYPWLRKELRLRASPVPQQQLSEGRDDEVNSLGASTDIQLMVKAEVLISTGSSFALAAAALAPVGAQLHFFWPPKELGMMRWHSAAAQGSILGKEPTAENISSTAWFRAYFARTNTIPVGFDGLPFLAYASKALHMMRSVDRAQDSKLDQPPIEPHLANECFESWTDCGPSLRREDDAVAVAAAYAIANTGRSAGGGSMGGSSGTPSLWKLHAHPLTFAKLFPPSDQLARQLCSSNEGGHGESGPPALNRSMQLQQHRSKETALALSDVAVGFMVPAPRLELLGTLTAQEACTSGLDLIACAAATWLPRALDTLLLVDCTPFCKVGSSAKHAEVAGAPAHGDMCETRFRRPLNVHHAPYSFHAPQWAARFNNLHRRCFYGPPWGSNLGTSPGLRRGASNVSPHHDWAKAASLLRAFYDLFGQTKKYFVKLDSDTVVEPRLLLEMLGYLHSRIVSQRKHVGAKLPAVAFGNVKGLHTFKACAPSSAQRECVHDPSSSRSVGHEQCLRGTSAWLRLLNQTSETVAAELARGSSSVSSASTYDRRRLVATSHANPAVHYASGTLYGLSQSALTRIVRTNCVEKLAGDVLCVEAKGTPSTLLEDANVGLCIHLLSIQLVQCDCITHRAAGQHGDPLPTADFFRCASPLSSHPVKRGEGYLAVAQMLRRRADWRYSSGGVLQV